MANLRQILKAIKKAAEEINKPEEFVKGEEFEEFIRKVLFPKDFYKLIRRTSQYSENKKDFEESTLLPDFWFEDIESGRDFFVEAKYRSSILSDGRVACCKNDWQLKRYKEIDKDTPVFICLGLGGKPRKPKRIFILPVRYIHYPKLFLDIVESYEYFYPKKAIYPSTLWKFYRKRY